MEIFSLHKRVFLFLPEKNFAVFFLSLKILLSGLLSYVLFFFAEKKESCWCGVSSASRVMNPLTEFHLLSRSIHIDVFLSMNGINGKKDIPPRGRKNDENSFPSLSLIKDPSL